MQKIDFEKVSNINIDCVIGLGKDCRVAKNLKTNNLRFFSSPFDWVIQYKLEDDLFLLKNHGKTFFKNYKPDPQYNQKEKIGIVDIDNGMVSMHDFRANLPNKLNHLLFKHKYKKRFERLHKILQDAKNICIVTSRQTNTTEILCFIEQFLQLYTFNRLYFINIYDINDKESDEKLIETKKDNITILEYFFNDEHPNGREKNVNPNFWLGNTDYWKKILTKISLNETFKKKHTHHKIIILSKLENIFLRFMEFLYKLYRSK